jgi:hypothetical protein
MTSKIILISEFLKKVSREVFLAAILSCDYSDYKEETKIWGVMGGNYSGYLIMGIKLILNK